MFDKLIICVMAICAVLLSAHPVGSRDIDLKPFWDSTKPLENPHKGWYHHFPDNHVKKYKIAEDSDLTTFPGMDHLYIRLAWAYLEPVEGQFNWYIIDQYIEKWTSKGLGIAFRISSRETSHDRIEQQFAAPHWVMQAGAQGDFWLRGEKVGPDGPWEPDFDDPIYLEKLEHFLQAFANRYDGQPWLRYIDIGSIGDWGEGHTHSGSRTLYDFAQRKKHVDLYVKYFKDSQLSITDDFVYNIENPDERQRMHDYVLANGITYRDDSPLVDYYVGAYPETFTVRSPEYFEAVYRSKPTIFELEHYATVKRQGNWLAEPGSSLAEHANGKTGADFFQGALELLHATYIGYHGYAHEWLANNPELTVDLLNRCGYWYFPHSVQLPGQVLTGKNQIRVTWENRGVAPAYHSYDLVFRLQGAQDIFLNVPSNNLNWMPSEDGKTYTETYTIQVPDYLPAGEYELSFRLFSPQAQETVHLPLNHQLKDDDGFYSISKIKIKSKIVN